MSAVHLLVLIHGMWGIPQHVAELARAAQARHNGASDDGVELRVLLAETNRGDSTYDGIDWGGERVAEEVMSEVEKIEKDGKTVTRFSVTGYSLGGLVARYLVGILHQREFFKTVTPVNFSTVATPHLGLPKSSGSMLSSLVAHLGPKLLSRTGEQFYCVDKWSKASRPLLEVMADPDCIFYQALLKFPHLTVYANAIYDVTVPYITAAIETEDPFAEHATNGIEIELSEDYSPLIKSYTVSTSPPAKPTIMSAQWFKNLKPDRPFLPPALQLRFPLNILLYIFLPVLIPLGISIGVCRLALASQSSRARIRLLEEKESNGQRLVHILSTLEQRVEDAVADFIDDPGPESDVDPPQAVSRRDPGKTSPDLIKEQGSSRQEKPKPELLTPLQVRMAAWLNTLPHLKKERAFIPRVRNSHAVIVCRDIKRFPRHREGEGVINHWADQFTL